MIIIPEIIKNFTNHLAEQIIVSTQQEIKIIKIWNSIPLSKKAFYISQFLLSHSFTVTKLNLVVIYPNCSTFAILLLNYRSILYNYVKILDINSS